MTNFIFPRSHIAGLTLSTAGSSTSFGVAAGQCADASNAAIVNQAAALTKTTGAWSSGGGVGALDTGTIAINTWYHAHKIFRPDTLQDDIAISTNVAAPTLGVNIPSAFTLSRRIGSMKIDGSGNWTAFLQLDDYFMWLAAVTDVSNFGLGLTAQLFSLSVPPDVSVRAKIQPLLVSSAAGGAALLSSPLLPSPAITGSNLSLYQATASTGVTGEFEIMTDTSRQIRGISNVSGAGNNFYVTTRGWIDRRGKDL